MIYVPWKSFIDVLNRNLKKAETKHDQWVYFSAAIKAY